MNTQNKHGAFWVRDYNKKKLYNLVRENAGISRSMLATMIDLTPTSVSKIINILIDEGLVMEQGVAADGKIGRNAIQLYVVPNKVLSIGISIDIFGLRGSIININGKELANILLEYDLGTDFDKIADDIADAVNTLKDKISEELRQNIIGVGLSAPGYINRQEGIIHQSPQLKWENYPIVDYLKRRLGDETLIILENNVKAAAMAECIYGTANDVLSSLIFDLGSGFGTALISKGRLQSGSHNNFGELGHILVESNGIRCSCGRYGCLRTRLARTSIEERTGIDFKSSVAAAKAGDPLCVDVLNEIVRYASIWLANAISIYDPSVIYLNGNMFIDWPELYDKIVESYSQYVWSAMREENIAVKKAYVLTCGNTLISTPSIIFYQYLMTGVQIETESLPI